MWICVKHAPYLCATFSISLLLLPHQNLHCFRLVFAHFIAMQIRIENIRHWIQLSGQLQQHIQPLAYGRRFRQCLLAYVTKRSLFRFTIDCFNLTAFSFNGPFCGFLIIQCLLFARLLRNVPKIPYTNLLHSNSSQKDNTIHHHFLWFAFFYSVVQFVQNVLTNEYDKMKNKEFMRLNNFFFPDVVVYFDVYGAVSRAL